MAIKCYAASKPGSLLEPFEYEPASLGSNDVQIQITHCGICHSDIHLIDNDWDISVYPLVPGHEIIGKVAAKGDAVKFDLGQRIGVGWQKKSCLECEDCMRGEENLCASGEATCVENYGGFAESVVLDSRFAHPIPEEISSENAAPLLCGGITVFSPFVHFGVKPTMHVGVVGIGGLGHLALQFAAAFGCEVTALSSSEDKEAEARSFGATRFVSSTDSETLSLLASTFDFILVTVHVDLDWPLYINLLKPNGQICFVGVPKSPLSIPVMPLISGRRSISGSPIGGRYEMRSMLNFAARNKIQASVEKHPFSALNEAVDRVRNNRAKYRLVLAW
ncbi:MAG: alcohol dehydrogenase [Proteobacteria bacterium]|nr:MAG: alcohol dehydrogenase [Pseudomonadota bacterium]